MMHEGELVGSSKLHGKLIHVISEETNIDADIPTHKVERGIVLSDHVERKPIVVKLTGLLIRPTKDRQESLVKKLEAVEIEGKPIVYEGRRIYKNMLLSNLIIKATANVMNGYEFSCTLTEVRIGKSSYMQPKTKAVAGKKENAGRKQTTNQKTGTQYHITKKGDTYIGLGKKYGTPWQDIKKWNGYPDKRIPTGVKVRVK